MRSATVRRDEEEHLTVEMEVVESRMEDKLLKADGEEVSNQMERAGCVTDVRWVNQFVQYCPHAIIPNIARENLVRTTWRKWEQKLRYKTLAGQASSVCVSDSHPGYTYYQDANGGFTQGHEQDANAFVEDMRAFESTVETLTRSYSPEPSGVHHHLFPGRARPSHNLLTVRMMYLRVAVLSGVCLLVYSENIMNAKFIYDTVVIDYAPCIQAQEDGEPTRNPPYSGWLPVQSSMYLEN
ncbi:hypothetical protein J6590_022973 [Homalodisca vitripennis]|nr:hypothetical protein J6590_022973 [Homalodisca vitripennis]